MARKKTDARELVVAQLMEIFFEYGFDGTTLNIISQRTGLGRASLYHHFPGGKTEMAMAVLEYSDRWCDEYIRKVALNESESAENRLSQMVTNLSEIHSRPEQLTPANAFAIGESAPAFGRHLQELFQDQIKLMTELMVKCGVPHQVALRRAWEVCILREGGLVCSRVFGDMGIFRNLMKRLSAYLLAPADNQSFLSDATHLPYEPESGN